MVLIPQESLINSLTRPLLKTSFKLLNTVTERHC
jgi:hypothetical protein